MRAIEIRPGNPRVFHHANVILDRSHAARRRESAPGSGFPGMDVIFEEETFEPDGQFLSWKPGGNPVVEPDGMAWRADPGMDLILNVHLKPTGKEETVTPLIGVYFTDKPQTRFPMLIQLEHDRDLDIPPGEKDFLVTDEYRAPMDLNVLAVYPHAHYLAKTIEAYVTQPDGSKKWLIRVPDWDLNWQGVFRYKSPVFIPKDSVVTMRIHYDNSTGNVRNPNNPPKRVTGGTDAKSEMSHFWLQVLPVAEGDHRAELQESVSAQQIQKYPDDFTANFRMGDLLLTRNQAAGGHPVLPARRGVRSALRAGGHRTRRRILRGAQTAGVGGDAAARTGDGCHVHRCAIQPGQRSGQQRQVRGRCARIRTGSSPPSPTISRRNRIVPKRWCYGATR